MDLGFLFQCRDYQINRFKLVLVLIDRMKCMTFAFASYREIDNEKKTGMTCFLWLMKLIK